MYVCGEDTNLAPVHTITGYLCVWGCLCEIDISNIYISMHYLRCVGGLPVVIEAFNICFHNHLRARARACVYLYTCMYVCMYVCIPICVSFDDWVK